MAARSKKSLRKGALVVQLDRSQVFPDEPGQGTPAMVRRFQYSATYWCAQNEGVLTDSDGSEWRLVDSDVQWLEDIDREVTEFLYGVEA